jgi:hypothetical protein
LHEIFHVNDKSLFNDKTWDSPQQLTGASMDILFKTRQEKDILCGGIHSQAQFWLRSD